MTIETLKRVSGIDRQNMDFTNQKRGAVIQPKRNKKREKAVKNYMRDERQW